MSTPFVIDCHGHYTTHPKSLEAWRTRQIAYAQGNSDDKPLPNQLTISDDDLRDTIERNQLRQMNQRGIDVTIFSPRAVYMAHHIGGFETSAEWAGILNELIYRITQSFPDRFFGGAMLPQSPGVSISTCLPELERCVNEFHFVCVNLNPDPSGGKWESLPLTNRYWYPLYEKMVELDIPAMIHASTSCNPCFHTTGAHYINADTTAFMQFLDSTLFKDFPTLQFVIPHGGGAVPYHWGRYRGLAQALGRPELREHLLNNIYFDTCVYHQAGINLLSEVIPTKNILFASEMIGAVRGVDPETGFYFDDTKRYIVNAPNLSELDRRAIFESNARRVYPRLDRLLKLQGR